MMSYKDIAQLSGYTGRVYSLISSLHALNNDVYPINERPPTLADDEPFYDMASIGGTIVEGPNRVELAGVPVVAPSGGAAGAERGGEELIKSLDLIVEVSSLDLVLVVLPRSRVADLESLSSFSSARRSSPHHWTQRCGKVFHREDYRQVVARLVG